MEITKKKLEEFQKIKDEKGRDDKVRQEQLRQSLKL